MEAVRGQGSKNMEIMSTTTATSLGYNLPNRNSSSSTSKISSPTAGNRTSSDEPAPVAHTNNNTLIFNDSPQASNHHHHHNHHHVSPHPLALPQNHNHQSQRPITDTDLTPSSSPLATTTTTPRTAPPAPAPLVRYRECQRNHAASMGSHVVDGCGEFMPSGEEGTAESLKCAACECHRNFHRKEVQGELQQAPNPNYHHTYYKHGNGHLPLPAPPPQPPQTSSLHHRISHAAVTTPTATVGPVPVPPLMMAFGGGPAESSSEDLNMFQCNAGTQLSTPAAMSRKRHRTKFSQQQKDAMMELAEKIGWRIQKQDEQEVQQFCTQFGVKRQVFKVWMHNNKQSMKKLQQM